MGPAVLIEESAVCHPALLIISGLTALILQGLLMARTLFFQLQRQRRKQLTIPQSPQITPPLYPLRPLI